MTSAVYRMLSKKSNKQNKRVFAGSEVFCWSCDEDIQTMINDVNSMLSIDCDFFLCLEAFR